MVRQSILHLHPQTSKHTHIQLKCVAGINGFLFGNLPGLSMCQGNKIHWHMIGLGNEVFMFCDNYFYIYKCLV